MPTGFFHGFVSPPFFNISLTQFKYLKQLQYNILKVMNQLVQIVNLILSTLTLLSDMVLAAGVFVMLVLFIPGRIRSLMKSLPVRFLSKYAYHFALIVALTATLGSLFYSE